MTELPRIGDLVTREGHGSKLWEVAATQQYWAVDHKPAAWIVPSGETPDRDSTIVPLSELTAVPAVSI